MEVLLAGYNLDRELLAGLSEAGREAATPETLSAAYARISRDPRPIPELRAEALRDVARARRSNEQIVFGFGHASVAEHAVFNLDVLGVSRLAIEALEATRLGSYTEKSQRYILLERDCLIPEEVRAAGLAAPFQALLAEQQEGYRRAYEALAEHHARRDPEGWAAPRTRRALEGAAKEDARYFLGLATTGQLGATLNARSLEATIGRLAAGPLAEVRELGRRMHALVAEVAPSLLRHTDPTAYRRETPQALGALAAGAAPVEEPCDGPLRVLGSERVTEGAQAGPPAGMGVTLLPTPPDAEVDLISALLHGCSGRPWAEVREAAARMDSEARRRIVLESLRRLGPHEAPLRAFELPEFVFELTLSATCFAQLKRHRMATLLPQAYDPALGATVPPVFAETGLVTPYAEICRASEALHARIRGARASDDAHPDAAEAAAAYALTNGHRRRVLFKANARELYHFARLRLDAHAQWDIRRLAAEMIRRARERMPLAMLLAAGKDGFAEARKAVFGE